jgi:DNA invertase Pin-like site-specific DNA recombinase
MKSKLDKTFRCAIYTRKSTEHGLELEFNSLDAQREACEAYIKSQASQGWQTSARKYDDPAFSGGNMERPALKRLLADIESGLVDVIVVYKIDRLTRSLADFAKLVEIFDAKSVSFVAVTQQFNTTTSMGRLTLNVLLSFAQFERELSSERVRDKVAASRKKGKWTGGSVPLGYDSVDKKLVINEDEAKTVRMVFSRYLVLKSFQALISELDEKGIITKTRLPGNKIKGGVPFTYGPLAYLLKNRTYLGETGHNGSWFEGEHEPIIEQRLFDQVQELLKANSVVRTNQRHNNEALLSGVLFDDRGNRMSPSYTNKNGVRYPFYISAAILKGRKVEAGSIARVSAAEIEAQVIKALQSVPEVADEDRSDVDPRALIGKHIDRVVLSNTDLKLILKSQTAPIVSPWSCTTKQSVAIDDANAEHSSAPNPQLVQAVARAHAWVRSLTSGTYDSIEALGKAVSVHPKIIRSGIRLAFLAPDITVAILAGEQPKSLSLADFKKDIPLSWTDQRAKTALA